LKERVTLKVLETAFTVRDLIEVAVFVGDDES